MVKVIDIEEFLKLANNDELPIIEQEPYKSKINSKIHNLYYIPSNAPMDYLKNVIEDVKKKENIK